MVSIITPSNEVLGSDGASGTSALAGASFSRPALPSQDPGSEQENRLARSADTTLHCRYELKYRIPESQAWMIAKYVESYIPLDKYSKVRQNSQYPIASLYFDSPQLNLCFETIDHKANRFKLRIRCYDDDPQSLAFVEIKRRINAVILKGRARVTKPDAQKLVEGNPRIQLPFSEDQEILNQFIHYKQVLNARPLIGVRYLRQAFESDTLNRVRITFDRELCLNTLNTSVLTTSGPGWERVPMNFVIMEIKFTGRYPRWLSDMVRMFNLKQKGMSKYCSSVTFSPFGGRLGR